MFHRELKPRETEILHMIRPTTFRDLVDAVRNEIDQSRYIAKKELRNLVNVDCDLE